MSDLTVFQLPEKWRTQDTDDSQWFGQPVSDGVRMCATELEATLAPLAELVRKVKELEQRTAHNGARMFSTNKNELGHDACCIKCKLAAALKEAGVE